MIELKKEFTTRELRQFAGLVWPAFCGMLGWLAFKRLDWPALAYGLWGAGAVGAVAGLAWPAAIRPVYQGLLHATFPIGWVMTHLLLGVLYYGLLTPIGWLRRTFGADPLHRRLDRAAATYWIPHPATTPSERYFRQY